MMENTSVIQNTRVKTDIMDVIKPMNDRKPLKSSRINHAMVKMLSEGGESLAEYLKSQGLNSETQLMVLSSNHHYYYDEKDLRNIRTLVNMKKLNLIEHLDSFLDTLYRILPPDANFVGYFTDSKILKRNNGFTLYHSTRILNQLINVIDSRTNHYMNRNQVLNLFAANGFKVVDMTEKEGLTFFFAKSNRKQAELRA